jgi:hypothetical protein
VSTAGKRAEANTPVMTYLLVEVDAPLTSAIPGRLTIRLSCQAALQSWHCQKMGLDDECNLILARDSLVNSSHC